MGIRGESSVAGNATEGTDEKAVETYSENNLMAYQVSISAVDRLFADGAITTADRRKAYTIIAKRHGLSLDSIFAENA